MEFLTIFRHTGKVFKFEIKDNGEVVRDYSGFTMKYYIIIIVNKNVPGITNF